MGRRAALGQPLGTLELVDPPDQLDHRERVQAGDGHKEGHDGQGEPRGNTSHHLQARDLAFEHQAALVGQAVILAAMILLHLDDQCFAQQLGEWESSLWAT